MYDCLRLYKHSHIHSPISPSVWYWFLSECVRWLANYESFCWHCAGRRSFSSRLTGWLVVTCWDSWHLTLLCGLLSTGATYFDTQIIPDLSIFVKSRHFFRAFPYRWAQQHVSGIFWTFSRQPWFLQCGNGTSKAWSGSFVWSLLLGCLCVWVVRQTELGERDMVFIVAVNSDVSLRLMSQGSCRPLSFHRCSFSPGPQHQYVYSFVEFCKHTNSFRIAVLMPPEAPDLSGRVPRLVSSSFCL